MSQNLEKSDIIDFKFVGFELEDDTHQNQEFIKFFNENYKQKTNSKDGQQPNLAVKSLEQYLNEMKSLKMKKNELLAILKNPLKVENQPQYKQYFEVEKQKRKDNGQDDNFEIDQTIEEFAEKHKLLSKIQKQTNDENAIQKIKIDQEIKSLIKNRIKMAWMQLYQNREIDNAKQCVIQCKPYNHHLLWLYFTMREVCNAKDISDCTLDISGQKLQDFQIDRITEILFQIINQCDHIQIYKLLLNQNRLTKINNLMLLFPRNITHLIMDLSGNELENKYFSQMFIPENIQKITLNISNNAELTSEALYYLGQKIHNDLDIELFVSENINQYDVLIDYAGKCHSLKINDKQIIYNDSFQLEMSVEDITQYQFLSLTSCILKNVNFEQNSTILQDRAFSLNSRDIRDVRIQNQKHTQYINLVEDNQERCKQSGNNQQLLYSQQASQKIKSQAELYQMIKLQLDPTHQHDEKSENIDVNVEHDVDHENGDDEDDDDEDDVDIIEKKDFILTVNGVKILDTTQDDTQLTLNLSQFEMDLFEDRMIMYWINSMPRIPTILLVKDLEQFDERYKTYAKLILSKREKDIFINDEKYDMTSFVLDFSLFSEIETDFHYLLICLLQNQSIEELEIQILNAEMSENQFNKLINQFDLQSSQKLKKLTIKTDLEGNFSKQQNAKRKYQLVIEQSKGKQFRKESVDFKDYEIFKLNNKSLKSVNIIKKTQEKKLEIDL